MSMKLKENEMKFIYAIDLDFLTTKLTKKRPEYLTPICCGWMIGWQQQARILQKSTIVTHTVDQGNLKEKVKGSKRVGTKKKYIWKEIELQRPRKPEVFAKANMSEEKT